MAKRGRMSWAERCRLDVVRTIEERIRSGESAQSVYTDLELKKYCSPRSFRRFAQEVRMQSQVSTGKRVETPSDAVIEAALRRELHQRLLAGTACASFLAQCRHLLEALRRPKPAEEGAE